MGTNGRIRGNNVGDSAYQESRPVVHSPIGVLSPCIVDEDRIGAFDCPIALELPVATASFAEDPCGGVSDLGFPSINIPVEMYQAIPESALWIIPNGRHVPIHDPRVPFVETTLHFLSREP
jgi:hypothetical protein